MAEKETTEQPAEEAPALPAEPDYTHIERIDGVTIIEESNDGE